MFFSCLKLVLFFFFQLDRFKLTFEFALRTPQLICRVINTDFLLIICLRIADNWTTVLRDV